MHIQLSAHFRDLSILVIGDIMLDTYIWGKAERLSPEAPVPVVEVLQRTSSPGGAANVAMNLQSLGARPILCSVTGADARGDELLRLIESQGIGTQGILRTPDRTTTTKFRIIANKTQLLRVDEEVNTPLPQELSRLLWQKIEHLIQKEHPAAIVFQDYDKGVITSYLIEETITLAQKEGILVCVDPKRRNFMAYREVTLFKPNLKEFREGLGTPRDLLGHFDLLEQEMRGFQEMMQCKILMVTLSDKGMALRYEEEGQWKFHLLPAEVRKVADVSGAGDTVISVAALGLAAGFSPLETARLANLAGGLVCEEVGVVPVDLQKLQKEYNQLHSEEK
ncbi:MAG: bifunctional heptose 7-phosphate kinase/heptose 1-phosphate adenyltransferase [Bacteroidales bacterium]